MIGVEHPEDVNTTELEWLQLDCPKCGSRQVYPASGGLWYCCAECGEVWLAAIPKKGKGA